MYMADAAAICEAIQRPHMRFVPLKTPFDIHRPKAHLWPCFTVWRQPPMRDFLALIPASGFESLEHDLYPYMETIDARLWANRQQSQAS